MGGEFIPMDPFRAVSLSIFYYIIPPYGMGDGGGDL